MGIPQSVGQEFAQADKGLKFAKAPTAGRPDLQKVNKPDTRHGKSQLFKEGGRIMAKVGNGITKEKMGSVKTAAPSRDGLAEKGKTKGKMPTMAGGKVLGTKVSSGSGMKSGGMAKMKKGGKAC